MKVEFAVWLLFHTTKLKLSNATIFLFTFSFVYTETYENDQESTLLKQEQILFTLEALTEATDNFDENKKLGEGGFGPVYKVCMYAPIIVIKFNS